MDRSYLSILCAVLLVCAFSAPAYAGEETVPDVVGLSLDQAQGLLQQAGFSAKIERVQGRPIGFVVSQSPGGFATSDTSAAVTLTVGGPTPKPGMPPSTTPSSADMPPAGAGTTPMGDAPMGDAPTGPAPLEAPAAGGFSWNGKALPPGRLPGGDGPEVPSVLGQSVDRARGVLRGWNLKVENTLAVPQLAGTIVNQWPPAGANVTAGETITVVVAITDRPSNEHRYIPQAERRTWRDAISLVERSGFTPRPVSVSSSAADRGLVVAQSPQPGSMALGGEAVRLFIGRGPGAYSADVAPQPTEPTTPMPGPVRLEPDTPPAGVGTPPVKPDPDLPPAGTGSMPIEPGADQPKPPTQPAPTQPEVAQPKPPVVDTTASIGTPSLSGPPAGESYPFKYGADFKWTSVRGAASYEFELQEELPSGAWQTSSTTSVTSTTHRPARIERGRYRWRVRGVTSNGGKGRWSDYRRLYMY